MVAIAVAAGARVTAATGRDASFIHSGRTTGKQGRDRAGQGRTGQVKAGQGRAGPKEEEARMLAGPPPLKSVQL